MTTLTLHRKVTGDAPSSIKRLQKNNINSAIGAPAIQQFVPTDDCVPFDYNRETRVEWATKCLVDAGGFDWKLFGSIEGILNPQTNKIEIWDGLGRLCMAQLAGITSIPVLVRTDGNPGAMFVLKQKLRNRSLNQEAFFVAAASSYVNVGTTTDRRTDSQISRDLKALEYIGLRVESGDKFFPQVQDASAYPSVKISALRRSLKLAGDDLDVVKKSRDIIHQAYASADYVGKELLEGFTFLFTAIPDAQRNTTYKKLGKFLKTFSSIPQDKLPFKKLGGNQHNDEARSIALGIVDMFKNSEFSQGVPGAVITKKAIVDYRRATDDALDTDI